MNSTDGRMMPEGSDKGEIVLYQPASSLELEVMIEDETVWLTQAQTVELFQTSVPNVNMHIRNATAEGELDANSVVKNFLITASDGKRYSAKHYCLDAVISVGYRVKPIRGVQFRRWAAKMLKEYALRGHSVIQRFENIEHRVSETEKKIDFFVRTSLPPVQGIFFEGQIAQIC